MNLPKFNSEVPVFLRRDDLFELSDVSTKLLDKVLLNMSTPNVFGLYGNWGIGKTSLINFIIEPISANQKKYGDIEYFRFDAWKYEHNESGDMLFALIDEMNNKFNVSSKRLYKQMAVLIGTVYSMRNKQIISKVLKEGQGIEELVYSEQERWVNSISKVKDEFDKFLKRILKKRKKKKLIVFIDDLDRCKPNNTVKILDAIRNYLYVENVIFVISIDRRVVSKMISHEFGMLENYGEEYLMKIIPHYYEMKASSHLINVKAKFDEFGVEYTEEREINYIKEFLKYFAPEPRVAKYFLNQFTLEYILNDELSEMVKADQDLECLRYAFVACFLLNKYPQIFFEDKSKRLKDINEYFRDLVVQKSKSRFESYKNVASRLPIREKDRVAIEEIFTRSIVGNNEARNRNIGIDPTLLTNVMRKIKYGK